MKMRLVLLVVLVLFGLVPLAAQTGEQLPPSVTWREIRLERFTVRFPAEFESEGRRVAAILSRVGSDLGDTLDVEVRPIVIILDNRGVVSNGYVSPTPYYSRWFHTPPQDGLGGTVDWLTLLAIHEGRHMAQFTKFSEGTSIQIAGILYGQTGQTVLGGLSFPGWWLEGDAVATETLMTDSGRGRLPGWEAEFRAAVLEGETFPLRSLYNGSYVYKLPYVHKYGYLIDAALRNRYGPEVMDSVVGRAADWAIFPGAFGRVLRKETGESVHQAYERALGERASEWLAYGEGPAPGTWSQVSPDSHFYTDYRQPRFLPDGRIIALRTGYGDVPALVLLDPKKKTPGGVRVLAEIAPSEYAFGFGGGIAAWAEARLHPRWSGQGITVVRWRDLFGESKTQGEIEGKESLLGPAVSPDGATIAAVELRRDGGSAVVFFSRRDGREIGRWAAPPTTVPRQLRWSDQGSAVFVLGGSGANSVVELVPGDSKVKVLQSPVSQTISWPMLRGNTLWFQAAYDGNQVTYARNLENGGLAVAASSAQGIYWVDAQGNRIAAQMPGFYGQSVSTGAFGSSVSIPSIPKERSYLEPSFGTEPIPDFSGLEEEAAAFSVRPAGGWGSVTSWGISPYPGVFLQAESLLGDWTATSELYALALIYGTDGIGTTQRVTWSRWWPEVSLALNGAMPMDASVVAATGDLEVALPLDFSRGLARRTVSVGAKLSLPLTSVTSNTPLLDYRMSAGLWKRSAVRDVFPELGILADVRYGHTLPFEGSRVLLRVNSYLPGFARHDGWKLGAAYQRFDGSSGDLPGLVGVPRGTVSSIGGNLAATSLDYAFPLGYPDFPIWDLTYFKRVRGQLFTDMAIRPDLSAWAATSGMELWLDFTLFNLPFDLSAGVRFAYSWANGGVRVEDTILGNGISWP